MDLRWLAIPWILVDDWGVPLPWDVSSDHSTEMAALAAPYRFIKGCVILATTPSSHYDSNTILVCRWSTGT
jgi:hypothetical protein